MKKETTLVNWKYFVFLKSRVIIALLQDFDPLCRITRNNRENVNKNAEHCSGYTQDSWLLYQSAGKMFFFLSVLPWLDSDSISI